uniref:RNA-binding S4 domain-containing protein n=1 Tax=Chromera velia CCMP2878 TaxID=1169474 RepID=A0A0G4I8X0_9ALVE|eukprot:Cvel_12072.t1-p1 / transcript=Cvel_12072.t1 / gene=Cvel_12072 / organism=Chromera_velia_CCMP2878 / gene_product=Putative RNA-binding protein YlmH, putative / transcript_product=Putative RNA-binding protein YlmH, putative / location=Cvel_scaffold776:26721-34285(-) / protein_length=285 / sequence_SO=supercontig / SO=protein_coding / is_pseudo=false
MQLTQAGANDLTALLRDTKCDIRACQSILNAVDTTLRSWEPGISDFVGNREVAALKAFYEEDPDVCAYPFGGHPLAERQRVLFTRRIEGLGDEEQKDTDADALDLLRSSVAALAVKGDFLFEPLKAVRLIEDFSIQAGNKPSKIGDALVTGDRGGIVFVARELVPLLKKRVLKIGTVQVDVSERPLDDLKIASKTAQPRVKEMQNTEASLRLDAVGSGGLGLSRSKISALINQGEVQLNWEQASSGTKTVKEGDVISATGRGRLEIMSIETTAKGKFRIKMKRIY